MRDCIICNKRTENNVCDKCYKEAMREKTEFIKKLSLDGFIKKEGTNDKNSKRTN